MTKPILEELPSLGQELVRCVEQVFHSYEAVDHRGIQRALRNGLEHHPQLEQVQRIEFKILQQPVLGYRQPGEPEGSLQPLSKSLERQHSSDTLP